MEVDISKVKNLNSLWVKIKIKMKKENNNFVVLTIIIFTFKFLNQKKKQTFLPSK